MDGSYRSYVVRVRRPGHARDVVRLDLEDLLGGVQVAIVGDEARSLADRLGSLIRRRTATDPRDRRASPPEERAPPG
jgi:hypothetical protein